MEIIQFGNTGINIKIYKGNDGKEDTWLDQDSIAKLYGRDQSVISRHISKIYKEKEVGKDTFQEVETIGTEGKNNGKTYKTKEYNLDVILSVGYKVNGKRGTEFRKWANQVLGKYLKQGYVVNDKVMLEKGMGEVLNLLNNAQRQLLMGKNGKLDDINEVLEIIKDYGYSFTTLQNYDEKNFVLEGAEKNTKFVLDYDSSIKAIEILKNDLIKKGEATMMFGQEKEQGKLGGILGNVFLGIFGRDAYPSLEEKASQLLYFIIKDHPFNDGNKRTASFLFSLFLKKNDFHLKSNGEYKINDNALAILVLLIAESDPKERDTYIKLLVNLLRKR